MHELMERAQAALLGVDRKQFLLILLLRLGVAARGYRIDPSDPRLASVALGGICEMMLKTAEQLASWEDGESGYPVDAFFEVLHETAVAAGCTYAFNWSLEQAVAFRP